jgi:hypothetical protein
MRAKLIYESQGVDEDVARRATEIAVRIRGVDSRLRKEHDPDDPSEAALMTRQVCREWMRVPDPIGGADWVYSVVANMGYYPEWGKVIGKAGRDETGVADFSITVNMCMIHEMRDKGLDILEETVAHELMHTKTDMREGSLGNRARTWSVSDILRSHNPGPPVKKEEGKNEYDPFLFSKYFLSKNEMTSYVQEIYSFMRENTLLAIAHNNTVDKEWFEKTLKTSFAYKHLCKTKQYVKEMDAGKVEEFINAAGKDKLKRILGVSTPRDFERVFAKRIKDMGIKIIKAAYKGYCDAKKLRERK